MLYLIVLSLATLGSSMKYSDYLGRDVSLPLSAALYAKDSSSCLQHRLGANKVENFFVELDGGSASGLIVTLPKLKTVALTFRADVAEPADFYTFKKLFFPLVNWRHEGKVSKFLAEAYRKLWRHGEMKQFFRKIMETRKNRKVLVAGHSLGGGVAALVAYDIVKEKLADKDKVTLITLGQTMVGDEKFAEAYEKKVGHSFRVVRRGDMIPHIPGKHRGYEYNGREVFYERYGMQSDGSTGFEICERDGCSSQQVNPVESKYNDEYFRRNVTRYGMKCK